MKNTSDKILATFTTSRASKTLGLKYGSKGHATIKATAQAYFCGGNKHPHFSVTGEIWLPGNSRNNPSMGGCIHDEILKYFPKLAPLVRLHLSNADDGEPMHAVANGFYHLAGATAHHFGEQYHGGNSKQHFPITPPEGKTWPTTEYREPTADECLATTAKMLRVDLDDVRTILAACEAAFKAGANIVAGSEVVTPQAEKARGKAGNAKAEEVFAAWCDTLRPGWKAEAEAGLALIKRLADAKESTAAA